MFFHRYKRKQYEKREREIMNPMRAQSAARYIFRDRCHTSAGYQEWERESILCRSNDSRLARSNPTSVHQYRTGTRVLTSREESPRYGFRNFYVVPTLNRQALDSVDWYGNPPALPLDAVFSQRQFSPRNFSELLVTTTKSWPCFISPHSRPR